MYNTHFKRNDRPSGTRRPAFRPYARQGGARRNAPVRGIDVSRYINKPAEEVAAPVFVPTHAFIDFSIDERLKANIVRKGYVTPTPIQDTAIPHVLDGKDVVGIANTGTGKTAAFLIPLIHKVLTRPQERILIMVPTRELAQQIAEELNGFSAGLRMLSVVCVGGIGIGPQIAGLRRNPQFVIGTPGRLKDLIERRVLSLGSFRTAVLDEGDRMLDMGFVNDMRRILALLPQPRQTLFFSATLSPEIERFIGEFIHDPVHVSVRVRSTAASVEQDVIRVPQGGSKVDMLYDLLVQPDFNKVLVFVRTKHGAERLAKILAQRGIKSESIHGNKTQGARQRALDLFKRDHVQALVATDVAARGLDISGVSHVINFDIPASHEDYIHRIGRTGRAGKKGKALTFVE